MTLSRRTAVQALGSLLIGALVPPALAGPFPDKPVKITVGFAPGGGADIVARQLSAKIGEMSGHQFIVDNKAGATGTIAAAGVAKSAADGYTLMLASQSTMVVAPGIYPKLPFDPVRDFSPITLLVSMPLVLVVNAGAPARSVQELMAAARADKGGLVYASAGLGGPQHVAGELFGNLGRFKLVHVPYKGEATALADVIGGQVPAMFANLPAVMPHVLSGKLRALAISSAKRHPSLPDLPTVAESGLAGFDVLTWYGLFAPAGTPDAVLRSLHDDAVKALNSKEISARFAEQGFTLIGNSPEQFSAFIKAEVPRWARLIKDANIHAE